MTLAEAALAPLRKYFVLSGRSSRKEYWSFTLAVTIAQFGALVALRLTQAPLFSILFGGLFLGALIPFLTVGVRRLHDRNRSGWWYLVALIPFVGAFIVLYWLVRASDPGPNQFGPHPYGHPGAQVTMRHRHLRGSSAPRDVTNAVIRRRTPARQPIRTGLLERECRGQVRVEAAREIHIGSGERSHGTPRRHRARGSRAQLPFPRSRRHVPHAGNQ